MVFAALVGFHHRDVEPNVLGAAGERQTSPGHDRSDSRGLDFVVNPLFLNGLVLNGGKMGYQLVDFQDYYRLLGSVAI